MFDGRFYVFKIEFIALQGGKMLSGHWL